MSALQTTRRRLTVVSSRQRIRAGRNKLRVTNYINKNIVLVFRVSTNESGTTSLILGVLGTIKIPRQDSNRAYDHVQIRSSTLAFLRTHTLRRDLSIVNRFSGVIRFHLGIRFFRLSIRSSSLALQFQYYSCKLRGRPQRATDKYKDRNYATRQACY